jgi:hypothetical protein
MKLHWFRRVGIFFVPISLPGWLILAAGAACAVYAFIDIDSRSHSVSDALMNFVFSVLIIGAVYSLAAYLTGGSGSLQKKDGPGDTPGGS